MDSSTRVEERIRALLRSSAGGGDGNGDGYTGFDLTELAEVRLLSANHQNRDLQFSFVGTAGLCNRSRNLHGGAASTLFDTLTSLVLLTLKDVPQWDTLGVTRNLSLTFIRPIPIGTKLFLNCNMVAAGRRLANLTGTMSGPDGKFYVTCTHDKVAVGIPQL